MHNDKIEIEVLADGSIKISTDRISPANHTSAEHLVREIQKMAGGPTKTQRKPGVLHVHSHGHHSHQH